MDSFDVKNALFDALKTALLADNTLPTSLCIVSSFDLNVTTFPRVVFQELTISTKTRTLDYEDYTKTLMYQIDIFSKSVAAETECRRIAKAANAVLEKTYHLEQRGGGNITSLDTVSKRFTGTYVGTFNEETGKLSD